MKEREAVRVSIYCREFELDKSTSILKKLIIIILIIIIIIRNVFLIDGAS